MEVLSAGNVSKIKKMHLATKPICNILAFFTKVYFKSFMLHIYYRCINVACCTYFVSCAELANYMFKVNVRKLLQIAVSFYYRSPVV